MYFYFSGNILKVAFKFYFEVSIVLGYAVCLWKDSVIGKSLGVGDIALN